MKIVILSDTHDLLRPEVVALLPGSATASFTLEISAAKESWKSFRNSGTVNSYAQICQQTQ